jgi:hypothetical protein
MFDRYLIGEDSLRNVVEDGKITGFQFDVRIGYYRGLGLSMVEGFDVSVDGKAYPSTDVLFKLHGKTFTHKQMETEYNERWEMIEPATLMLPEAGGLDAGEHEVSMVEYLRISYLPAPSISTGKGAKRLKLQPVS